MVIRSLFHDSDDDLPAFQGDLEGLHELEPPEGDECACPYIVLLGTLN